MTTQTAIDSILAKIVDSSGLDLETSDANFSFDAILGSIEHGVTVIPQTDDEKLYAQILDLQVTIWSQVELDNTALRLAGKIETIMGRDRISSNKINNAAFAALAKAVL